MKRLGSFQLPKRLVKDKETASETYAKFTAEPLETGYGHTLGNSLRRVLLSSIEGAAITSIKMDGAQHEFKSMDGIIEDVTDIVLNLKKISLKSHKREPVELMIDVTKEGVVTAGDIKEDANIEILNPDQVICTLDKKIRFFAEIQIQVGRGYYPAEQNKEKGQPIGVIPIDSLFSPVRLVKYSVEDTRVGMITDYDKLILEIWTDGRISPDDALKESAVVFSHHLDVFHEISQQEFDIDSADKEESEEDNLLRERLNMSVNEIELSVRAANCLNNANITTVGELASKSEQEMLKYRNFGKKSLTEIKEKLEKLGLSLGRNIQESFLDNPINHDGD